MKDYAVSYYLNDFHFSYIVTANNEYEVIEKVLKRIPDGSKNIFHGLKVERFYSPWN